MKERYQMGGDIFISCAFISFVLGGAIKLFEMSQITFVVCSMTFVKLSVMCLLFSIALSLMDISHKSGQ